MRERLSARELGEWHAFERVYGPLTVQERVDTAGAVAAWAAVVAMHGSEGGGSPSDYLPDWTGERAEAPQQTDEQMMAFMSAFKRRRS